MTNFGLYLAKRSVNKSELARKTGLSKARLSQLSNNGNAHLRADELAKVALAIQVDPGEMLKTIYSDLFPTPQLTLPNGAE